MPADVENQTAIPNATILHDFINKLVVLRPDPTVREEITIEDYAKYIGYDLLKEN